MITLQHAALFAMACLDKTPSSRMWEEVDYGMPWALLPDAIRAYTRYRQPSHFEETLDGEIAWMVYPTSSVLKQLTPDTISVIDMHMDTAKYPKCAIGENTRIECFDRYNYGHPAFHYIRSHLLQDIVMDEILRNCLIDATRRFDDLFPVRENRTLILDGQALRKEILRFEHSGFLHLVGKIYRKTGILFDQEWFDTHVYEVLGHEYPDDLVEQTYKYMHIPENISEKINNLDFGTNERIFELSGDELEAVWDAMYAKAYIETYKEL